MVVYKPRPVSQEPRSVLRTWRVFEVDIPALGAKTRHFAGFNLMTYDGRVSSPIQSFDLEARTGVTRSGRVYELEGDPGDNDEVVYVWKRWCMFNGIDLESVKEVTDEYVKHG